MNALSILILIKLVITIFTLAGPFLMLPREKLERQAGVSAKSVTFFRLYGMAMLALATAYSGGLWLSWQGHFPWTVVLMGSVSNCGAALVLLQLWPQRTHRVPAFVFGLVGTGFVLSALFPGAAIASL